MRRITIFFENIPIVFFSKRDIFSRTWVELKPFQELTIENKRIFKGEISRINRRQLINIDSHEHESYDDIYKFEYFVTTDGLHEAVIRNIELDDSAKLLLREWIKKNMDLYICCVYSSYRPDISYESFSADVFKFISDNDLNGTYEAANYIYSLLENNTQIETRSFFYSPHTELNLFLKEEKISMDDYALFKLNNNHIEKYVVIKTSGPRQYSQNQTPRTNNQNTTTHNRNSINQNIGNNLNPIQMEDEIMNEGENAEFLSGAMLENPIVVNAFKVLINTDTNNHLLSVSPFYNQENKQPIKFDIYNRLISIQLGVKLTKCFFEVMGEDPILAINIGSPDHDTAMFIKKHIGIYYFAIYNPNWDEAPPPQCLAFIKILQPGVEIRNCKVFSSKRENVDGRCSLMTWKKILNFMTKHKNYHEKLFEEMIL